MTERWVEIHGWEGEYEVSSRGKVRNSRTNRVLRFSQPNEKYKYLTVLLSRSPHQKRLFVHKVVCEAFHGVPPSNRHEGNHINGIKTDNRASNLEWVTPSENIQHSWDVGLRPRKLSESGRRNILEGQRLSWKTNPKRRSDIKKATAASSVARMVPTELVVKAIEGSKGHLKTIGERLGCGRATVYLMLVRETPLRDPVRRAYRKECKKVGKPLPKLVREAFNKMVRRLQVT
jgi:hypothetical protein